MEIKKRFGPTHRSLFHVDINIEGVIGNVIGPLDPTLSQLLDMVEKLVLSGTHEKSLWKSKF